MSARPVGTGGLRVVNALSLCAGAGGLDLGLRMAIPAARTVCFVEIEAFACEVLATQMDRGRLDPAPIWTDLKTFDGRPWRGVVDLVAAGYPCQPFSVAGKRGGSSDPRHLWPHVARIIGEVEPSLVFLENVPGHLRLGFREVADELRGLGYRVAAGLFTAEEVGAPHRRQRLFILAYADRHQLRDESGGVCGSSREDQTEPRHARATVAHANGSGRKGGELEGSKEEGRPLARAHGDADVAHSDGHGLEGERRGGLFDSVGQALRNHLNGRGRAPFPPPPDDEDGWREYLARFPSLEPSVLRSAHVVANRVDRLRAIGNGVVPDQAALAFRTLAAALGGIDEDVR